MTKTVSSRKIIEVADAPKQTDTVAGTAPTIDVQTMKHSVNLQPIPVAKKPAIPSSSDDDQSTKTTDTSAAVNTLAQKAASQKPDSETTDTILEAEVEKVKKIDELVSSKKYFLPISQASSSSAVHKLITVLIVLILGITVVNFLIDAEIITTDIKPLTNLIG